MSDLLHDKIGPFQILRLLGVGGMAQVYHAVDPSEGVAVVVALKVPRQHVVMDESARASFLREARIVAEMGSHPNIVHVSRVGVDNDLPYMVMEYITGIDLAKLSEPMRQAKEQWSEPAILWVLAGIIQGLKHAWGAEVAGRPLRIVHRDITPSNIMLTYEGYVKIGDFGIAQQVGKDNSGSIRGKYRYMPVEQLQGRATTASDMYAVGAIAWELIEGKKFRGDKKTEEEMLLAAYNGERPDITRSDISQPLIKFVYALLNPNEKARIQNPIDAWARLKACPGVNLIDPDPVQIMIRGILGRRRSGCTDVEVVVVHPELAATRAALAAAAKNKDSGGQSEVDARRHRPSSPEPTVQLEPDEAAAERTTTIALPEPTFPNQPTPTPHAGALAHPIVSTPQAARPTAPAPARTLPVPTPAAAPTLTRTLTQAHPTTLPVGRTAPRHRKSQWLALVGLTGLFLAVAIFTAPRLLIAFAAQDIDDERSVVRSPSEPSIVSQRRQEPPTPQARPPATIIPIPPPSVPSVSAPSVPAPDSDAQDTTSHQPSLTRPEPESPPPTAVPAKRLLDTVEPESGSKPKPKPKPRTTILVRLGVLGSLELRIGKKVRHITGNTTLRLRPGSKRLAVRRPNTTIWYSTTKPFEPGKEYLLRLYGDRLDLILLQGDTDP